MFERKLYSHGVHPMLSLSEISSCDIILSAMFYLYFNPLHHLKRFIYESPTFFILSVKGKFVPIFVLCQVHTTLKTPKIPNRYDVFGLRKFHNN